MSRCQQKRASKLDKLARLTIDILGPTPLMARRVAAKKREAQLRARRPNRQSGLTKVARHISIMQITQSNRKLPVDEM